VNVEDIVRRKPAFASRFVWECVCSFAGSIIPVRTTATTTTEVAPGFSWYW
jgi:hypothetical protein